MYTVMMIIIIMIIIIISCCPYITSFIYTEIFWRFNNIAKNDYQGSFCPFAWNKSAPPTGRILTEI